MPLQLTECLPSTQQRREPLAKEVTLDQDYTYESSGLDDFLVRQQDYASPLGSDMGSGELNFDNQQVGGAMADNLRVGGVLSVGDIEIDGNSGKISMYKNGREILSIDSEQGRMIAGDGSKKRLVLGNLPGGDYGLVVSKEGYDVISEALEE